MQEGMVKYLNNYVSEKHFRAFIYDIDGNKKLVNSWQEFKRYLAFGNWYQTIEEAHNAKLLKSSAIDMEETINDACRSGDEVVTFSPGTTLTVPASDGLLSIEKKQRGRRKG